MNRRSFLRNANLAAVSLVAGGGLLGCMKRPVGAAVAAGALPVGVLGCGAVGLATARLAQEAGFEVTIYTKAMPPETTSNIAGGQWYPASVYDPGKTLTPEFSDQFVMAARYGYRRYQIMTDP